MRSDIVDGTWGTKYTTKIPHLGVYSYACTSIGNRIYFFGGEECGHKGCYLNSLSELTGCEILLKCEQQNPGGSIKDRAALQLVNDAILTGNLTPGMTIVEGTAGNTGIGLALVAKAYGYKMLVVMPKGQAKEKEQMIRLRYIDKNQRFVAYGEENHNSTFWADLYDGNQGFIVYGHQCFQEVNRSPHALGIDTGCVYGNKLSAAVFNNVNVDDYVIHSYDV